MPSRSAAYLTLHDSAVGMLSTKYGHAGELVVVIAAVAVADRQSVPLLPPPQLAGPCGSLKRSAMITFGYEQ